MALTQCSWRQQNSIFLKAGRIPGKKKTLFCWLHGYKRPQSLPSLVARFTHPLLMKKVLLQKGWKNFAPFFCHCPLDLMEMLLPDRSIYLRSMYQSSDRYSKLVSARPIPLLAAPVSAYTDTNTVLEGSIGDTDTDTVMSRKYSRYRYLYRYSIAGFFPIFLKDIFGHTLDAYCM